MGKKRIPNVTITCGNPSCNKRKRVTRWKNEWAKKEGKKLYCSKSCAMSDPATQAKRRASLLKNQRKKLESSMKFIIIFKKDNEISKVNTLEEVDNKIRSLSLENPDDVVVIQGKDLNTIPLVEKVTYELFV